MGRMQYPLVILVHLLTVIIAKRDLQASKGASSTVPARDHQASKGTPPTVPASNAPKPLSGTVGNATTNSSKDPKQDNGVKSTPTLSKLAETNQNPSA